MFKRLFTKYAHAVSDEYELTAFLPGNIMRTCNEKSKIENNDGYYSYTVTAKLIEKTDNGCKVSVKGLIIGIDYIPSNIEIGGERGVRYNQD